MPGSRKSSSAAARGTAGAPAPAAARAAGGAPPPAAGRAAGGAPPPAAGRAAGGAPAPAAGRAAGGAGARRSDKKAPQIRYDRSWKVRGGLNFKAGDVIVPGPYDPSKFTFTGDNGDMIKSASPFPCVCRKAYISGGNETVPQLFCPTTNFLYQLADFKHFFPDSILLSTKESFDAVSVGSCYVLGRLVDEMQHLNGLRCIVIYTEERDVTLFVVTEISRLGVFAVHPFHLVSPFDDDGTLARLFLCRTPDNVSAAFPSIPLSVLNDSMNISLHDWFVRGIYEEREDWRRRLVNCFKQCDMQSLENALANISAGGQNPLHQMCQQIIEKLSHLNLAHLHQFIEPSGIESCSTRTLSRPPLKLFSPGEKVITNGNLYTGFRGVGRIGTVVGHRDDGKEVQLTFDGLHTTMYRQQLNPLRDLYLLARMPTNFSIVRVVCPSTATNDFELTFHGLCVSVVGSVAVIILSGPVSFLHFTSQRIVYATRVPVEYVHAYMLPNVRLNDIIDIYSRYSKGRSLFQGADNVHVPDDVKKNIALSLFPRSRTCDQSAFMSTTREVHIEWILNDRSVACVSFAVGSIIVHRLVRMSELHVTRKSSVDEDMYSTCWQGPKGRVARPARAPPPPVAIALKEGDHATWNHTYLVYVVVEIFGCYIVKYIDEAGVHEEYVRHNQFTNVSSRPVTPRMDFAIPTALLDHRTNHVVEVIKEAAVVHINKRVDCWKRSLSPNQIAALSYYLELYGPIVDQDIKNSVIARIIRLYGLFDSGLSTLETTIARIEEAVIGIECYQRLLRDVNSEFSALEDTIVSIEETTDLLTLRTIERLKSNTLFLVVSLNGRMCDALALEASSIETDLLVEQVEQHFMDPFLDDLLSDAVQDFTFLGVAQNMILQDAAAGTVSRQFVGALTRLALPRVSFHLVPTNERNSFSEEHVEQNGHQCSFCMHPFDCLGGGAVSLMCCDFNPIVCRNCIPLELERHRIRRPHGDEAEPVADGGFRTSEDAVLVPILLNMRDEFRSL